MVDTSKIYILHNVYDDAKSLLETMPANCIAIPAGWDEKTENKRNTLLKEMGLNGYSALPCVLHHVPEQTVQIENEEGKMEEVIIPAHWEEMRVSDMQKRDWKWEKINTRLQIK